MKSIKLSEIKEDMIWYDNPANYEYVRKTKFSCCNVSFKPITKADEKRTGCKLIGYQKPEKISVYPDGVTMYSGVYFWLKPYDRGMQNAKECYGQNKNHYPAEAVKIIYEVEK